MQRRPLIAGNWKMNGSQDMARDLIQSLLDHGTHLSNIELAVFPPAIYLPLIKDLLAASSIAYGGQDLSDEKPGAFTGDIAAEMLIEYGSRYVIVGHSERRHYHNETNDVVAKKTHRALSVGLVPVICVGETLSQREKNQTTTIIREQLEPILTRIDQSDFQMVIAYEPVWAIGTGKSATPEQAQSVHKAIREQINEIDPKLAKQTRILYGGSVKPDNAEALFRMSDIDGALVGGASLQANQFLEIGTLCNNLF